MSNYPDDFNYSLFEAVWGVNVAPQDYHFKELMEDQEFDTWYESFPREGETDEQ